MNTITDAKTDEFIANIIHNLHERIEMQIWIMVHRMGRSEADVLELIRDIQNRYKGWYPNAINSVGMLRFTVKYLKWLQAKEKMVAE